MLNELIDKPFDANRRYGDIVHFVTAYIIEPHPGDDISPYSGQKTRPSASPRQPRTYSGRRKLARDVQALLADNHLVLIDDLTPRGRNNPLWCSYGTAPNAAFLISQNGEFFETQLWTDVDALESAIGRLMSLR